MARWAPLLDRGFDIGNTVRAALGRFESTGEALAGARDPESAANGSIMRLAPVPLAFAGDIETAIRHSGESSRTTHAAPRPVDACRYLGALIATAATGGSKADLLDDRFWRWGELHPEIEAIARGSFKQRDPPEIRGTGFVVHSLEAALWAFHKSGSFEEGCLLAVNLGEDADTTGAVYGQLAGAVHGAAGIPPLWRERLALRDVIEALADRLFLLSGLGNH